MAENSLFKIGITHGDINGIGYEIIMKALCDNKILDLCTPVVYGLTKVASYHRKALDLGDFTFNIIKSAEQASLKSSNLINLSENEVKVDLGVSTQIAGQMSELALNTACRDLNKKLIDAIVTGPINKNNIQSESFKFYGHTEYLAHFFNAPSTMMMMVAENIRLGFVTNHLPIAHISEVVDKNLILKKLRILNHSLVTDFACTNPKIAVLALNPHGGDHNLIGKEETDSIVPAINQAFDEKINVFGPFPADGFFGSGKFTQYDAVLAMYHDQGMIPFKLLSMEEGVNFTAGLPVVRTSPAHGTAYDLAGKNIASAQSMRNAIYLAIDILRNRKMLEKKF